VEDQERAQEEEEAQTQGQRSTSTWSAAEEEETGGPDKKFQAQIAKEFEAMIKGTHVSSGLGRKMKGRDDSGDDDGNLLTADSRSSSVSGGVRIDGKQSGEDSAGSGGMLS
jgi:hypothetical protein